MRFIFKTLFKLIKWVVLVGLFFTLLLTIPLRFFNPPITSYVIHANLSGASHQNLRQTWVPYEAIPANVPLAVIAGEDQRFPQHMGVDVTEIKNAIEDYQSGRPLRGASTLTQQLIKNLYLWPERSYLRKGIEAWLALWLEITLPKERILELYLNTAQFSRAYFGVEASSQFLFNQSVQTLSDKQAAYLAACLPSPAGCRPNNTNSSQARRQAFIEKHMRLLGMDTLKLL